MVEDGVPNQESRIIGDGKYRGQAVVKGGATEAVTKTTTRATTMVGTGES